MSKPTEILIQSVLDCIQFDGYTQGLSMLVRHKLTAEDKIVVINELHRLLDNETPLG